MGIASFCTSMFPTAQMAQLKSDIGVQADQQNLIIEQLEEQISGSMMLHNLFPSNMMSGISW